MYFNIITFGCKLNQAESEKMAADLISLGLIKNISKPNLIIINACAVTHKAVRDGRQRVAQLRRQHPQARIIVTGCYEAEDWFGVNLWFRDKHKLIKYFQKEFILDKNNNQKIQLNFSGRSRALIKIQTGCNNFCSYCIVPFMRGSQLIDTPVEEVVKQVLIKEKQGFQEVVLTGVNIGLYGKNIKTNLVNLLKKILQQTSIQRIRLGSIWPTHVTTELIKIYSQELRLCPHFHLSLQSGSNKILKLMNRHYTIEQVKDIIKRCRIKIPHINFTTDIIVGFPGETEQNFKQSCKLIKNIGFSKVHIFKYSKRPGTKAIELSNQVKEQIKNKRSQTLIKLAEQVTQQTKQKVIGMQLPVLWEHRRTGYYYGFTNNYIRVKKKARSEQNLENKIETIKLIKSLLV